MISTMGTLRLLEDGSVALVVWNGGPLLPNLARNNRPLAADDAPGRGVTDRQRATRNGENRARRVRMLEVQRSAAARGARGAY